MPFPALVPPRLPGAQMPLPALASAGTLGSAGVPINGIDQEQMAVHVTQQQALEYEQSKMNSGNIEPEVVELAHHFCLSERHARLLNEQLKKRNNTYEDDIA